MRYSKSTNKKRLRKVREETKALVVQVEEILNILKKAEAFVAYAQRSTHVDLMARGEALAGRLHAMQQVAHVARRRVFDNEKIPNSDKVFSIFEPTRN